MKQKDTIDDAIASLSDAVDSSLGALKDKAEELLVELEEAAVTIRSLKDEVAYYENELQDAADEIIRISDLRDEDMDSIRELENKISELEEALVEAYLTGEKIDE